MLTIWIDVLVILSLGGLIVYINKKAKNLAQKQDLEKLTEIVERIRAQFDRINVVYRIQFEAEFKAYQEMSRTAHDVFREFIRLNPAMESVGSRTNEQLKKLGDAQLAFTDALEGCKPFVPDQVWKVFYDFEGLIINEKSRGLTEMPNETRSQNRRAVELAFEQCAAEIKKRLSELLVV
jgi:hypothetical protein